MQYKGENSAVVPIVFKIYYLKTTAYKYALKLILTKLIFLLLFLVIEGKYIGSYQMHGKQCSNPYNQYTTTKACNQWVLCTMNTFVH